MEYCRKASLLFFGKDYMETRKICQDEINEVTKLLRMAYIYSTVAGDFTTTRDKLDLTLFYHATNLLRPVEFPVPVPRVENNRINKDIFLPFGEGPFFRTDYLIHFTKDLKRQFQEKKDEEFGTDILDSWVKIDTTVTLPILSLFVPMGVNPMFGKKRGEKLLHDYSQYYYCIQPSLNKRRITVAKRLTGEKNLIKSMTDVKQRKPINNLWVEFHFYSILNATKSIDDKMKRHIEEHSKEAPVPLRSPFMMPSGNGKVAGGNFIAKEMTPENALDVFEKVFGKEIDNHRNPEEVKFQLKQEKIELVKKYGKQIAGNIIILELIQRLNLSFNGLSSLDELERMYHWLMSNPYFEGISKFEEPNSRHEYYHYSRFLFRALARKIGCCMIEGNARMNACIYSLMLKSPPSTGPDMAPSPVGLDEPRIDFIASTLKAKVVTHPSHLVSDKLPWYTAELAQKYQQISGRAQKETKDTYQETPHEFLDGYIDNFCNDETGENGLLNPVEFTKQYQEEIKKNKKKTKSADVSKQWSKKKTEHFLRYLLLHGEDMALMCNPNLFKDCDDFTFDEKMEHLMKVATELKNGKGSVMGILKQGFNSPDLLQVMILFVNSCLYAKYTPNVHERKSDKNAIISVRNFISQNGNPVVALYNAEIDGNEFCLYLRQSPEAEVKPDVYNEFMVSKDNMKRLNFNEIKISKYICPLYREFSQEQQAICLLKFMGFMLDFLCHVFTPLAICLQLHLPKW